MCYSTGSLAFEKKGAVSALTKYNKKLLALKGTVFEEVEYLFKNT